MNFFKVNGREYDVIVTGIEETFNILYSENTGRTMVAGSRMVLDPLGTYIGHKVTVKRKSGYESAFDELYKFFLQPRNDGIFIEVAHLQDAISYEAYVSSGGRNVEKIDKKTGKVYWGELILNFIPMEAQIIP